jgi:RHS repeat-associated protein
VRPEGGKTEDGTYQRNYKWNERNLLSESSDGSYTVQYRYGADGQRALKFTANSGRSTVYFNKMWQASDVSADWLQGKHVYVGEDRIATKYNSEGNDNTQAEKERTYYYHSDHLGSAQTVTNWKGQVHERLEYTPYGELWIDWKSADAPEDSTPFRFTGKEPDPETGLYYYGARYLDPKTSRWLSGDPAVGEYLPSAPVDDEAKKRNGNLPGQGGVFNYVNLHVYHYAGNNPVKYTDPDGEVINLVAGGIGAVIGAGIGAAVAIASGGSGRDIAAAAVGGAVTGGMAGLTMGGSLAVQVAAGALAGTAGYMTSSMVQGESYTAQGIVGSATGGATGAMGGAVLNKLISAAGSLVSHTRGYDPVSAITKAATGRASTGMRDFPIGTSTSAEANELGKAWVGDGYRSMKNGGGYVSADGTRTYRFPTGKNSSYATTGVQANFEHLVDGKVVSNGHLNIKD